MACDTEGMQPGRAFEHRARHHDRAPKTLVKSDTHPTRHPLISEPIPELTEDELLYAEHAIQRAARDIGASDEDIALVLDMLGIREMEVTDGKTETA